MNRIVLIGNLARDPELRYTSDKVPVLHFTLAVDRPFTTRGGQRETDFIPVVVWRAQAETCSRYLQKGSQVAVDGRLQVRSYEDGQGIRRRTTEVVASRVVFLQRLRKSAPQEESEISLSGEDTEEEGGE